MPIKITKFDHTTLVVPAASREKVVKFYENILGLRRIAAFNNSAKDDSWMYALGDKILHIDFNQSSNKATQSCNFAITIENMDEARRHFLSSNLELYEDADFSLYKRFHIDDPFGNRIEFLEANQKEIKSCLDKVIARGKLRIGVADDVEGKSLWSPETLRMEGWEPAIGRLLATELFGNESFAEFVVVAGKGKINSLKESRVDLVISLLTITEERAAQIDFSTPYFTDKEVLMVLKGGLIKSLADLKGRKVAITAASATLPRFREYFPETEILVVQNKPEGVEALKSHRVDAMANTFINLSLMKTSMPDGDQYEILDTGNQFPPKHYGVGIKKGCKDLVQFISTSLKKLEKNGDLKALAKKFGIS